MTHLHPSPALPNPSGGPALPSEEGRVLSTLPILRAGDLQGVARTARMVERMRPHLPTAALVAYLSLLAAATIFGLSWMLYGYGWVGGDEFAGAGWLACGIFSAGLIFAGVWLLLAAVFGEGDWVLAPVPYDPLGDLSSTETPGVSAIFEEVNQ